MGELGLILLISLYSGLAPVYSGGSENSQLNLLNVAGDQLSPVRPQSRDDDPTVTIQ